MKDIGKPCAGKPQARFDEGGLGLSATATLLGHRQTKGPANRQRIAYRRQYQLSTLPGHTPTRSLTPDTRSRDSGT